MFKRVIWFTSGAASGAAGSWWVRRRIRERLRRYTPGGLRQKTAARLKQVQADGRSAIDETRRLANSYRAEQTRSRPRNR